MSVLHAIFPSGFFSSTVVQRAALVGVIVAVVCAPVGAFTVIRGQAFAGHAFSDITATGGSAAFLLGLNPLVGFAAMGLGAGAAMEMLGVERRRGRDLVTGILLGGGLGLSALFLYLTTTAQTTTGATVTVLFGSIFAVSGPTLPAVAALGAVAVGLVALTYRPLLLSSVSVELARAQNANPRAVGFAYMVALPLAVALSALTVGAILSTALLIGPAATSLRLARSPGRAIALAALIGTGVVWLGILLAYDSYSWPPSAQGWPVSFFVVMLVLACYLLGQLKGRPGDRRRGPFSSPPRAGATGRSMWA